MKMKKKVTIMALIIVMLISILAGCVPNTKDNKKESETMTASEMLKSVAASNDGKVWIYYKNIDSKRIDPPPAETYGDYMAMYVWAYDIDKKAIYEYDSFGLDELAKNGNPTNKSDILKTYKFHIATRKDHINEDLHPVGGYTIAFMGSNASFSHETFNGISYMCFKKYGDGRNYVVSLIKDNDETKDKTIVSDSNDYLDSVD